ncbi:MAG: hypothetical protein OHK006_08150 [Thermodesulfovibrionales bacterium]
MKIVFDTAVYISAFTIRRGLAEDAMMKCLDDGTPLAVSRDMINAVLSQLSAKFRHDREVLDQTALYIGKIAEIVHPSAKLCLFLERADNLALECALGGRADLVVTTSRRLLKLGSYGCVRIADIPAYLGLQETLGGQPAT